MKYWYKITHFECPICGRDKVYRQRVYKKTESGHEYINDYDYCND